MVFKCKMEDTSGSKKTTRSKSFIGRLKSRLFPKRNSAGSVLTGKKLSAPESNVPGRSDCLSGRRSSDWESKVMKFEQLETDNSRLKPSIKRQKSLDEGDSKPFVLGFTPIMGGSADDDTNYTRTSAQQQYATMANSEPHAYCSMNQSLTDDFGYLNMTEVEQKSSDTEEECSDGVYYAPLPNLEVESAAEPTVVEDCNTTESEQTSNIQYANLNLDTTAKDNGSNHSHHSGGRNGNGSGAPVVYQALDDKKTSAFHNLVEQRSQNRK